MKKIKKFWKTGYNEFGYTIEKSPRGYYYVLTFYYPSHFGRMTEKKLYKKLSTAKLKAKNFNKRWR